MIIDTHTHVAEPCLLARTVGAIERGYPILPVTDLLDEMRLHDVSHAVLVQWGSSFDHHYLAQCLTSFPERFTGVCEIDYRRDDACAVLRCLVEKHGFKGVRITSADRSPGRDPLALWRTAAELDIAISVSARSSEEFVSGLSGVLPQLQNVRMRIEHLGRPPYDQPWPHPTFDDLLRYADYPNVYMNLDGFLSNHYPDHRRLTDFPFVEYQPFVRQAVSAFGPERCMWGSEFPFLNNGYDIGIRFLRTACPYISATQQSQILSHTPIVFWRIQDSDKS